MIFNLPLSNAPAARERRADHRAISGAGWPLRGGSGAPGGAGGPAASFADRLAAHDARAGDEAQTASSGLGPMPRPAPVVPSRSDGHPDIQRLDQTAGLPSDPAKLADAALLPRTNTEQVHPADGQAERPVPGAGLPALEAKIGKSLPDGAQTRKSGSGRSGDSFTELDALVARHWDSIAGWTGDEGTERASSGGSMLAEGPLPDPALPSDEELAPAEFGAVSIGLARAQRSAPRYDPMAVSRAPREPIKSGEVARLPEQGSEPRVTPSLTAPADGRLPAQPDAHSVGANSARPALAGPPSVLRLLDREARANALAGHVQSIKGLQDIPAPDGIAARALASQAAAQPLPSRMRAPSRPSAGLSDDPASPHRRMAMRNAFSAAFTTPAASHQSATAAANPGLARTFLAQDPSLQMLLPDQTGTVPPDKGAPESSVSSALSARQAASEPAILQAGSLQSVNAALGGAAMSPGGLASGPNGAPVLAASAANAPSLASDSGLAAQIEDAIDQIAGLREAGRAQRSELMIRHSEFGPIAMRIEAAAGDLRVALSSRDPGFVPALQAGLVERAAEAGGANGNGQSSSQQSGSQRGGDSQAGAGAQHGSGERYGSSPGSQQGSAQPYSRQESGETTRALPNEIEPEEGSIGGRPRDQGLYA